MRIRAIILSLAFIACVSAATLEVTFKDEPTKYPGTLSQNWILRANGLGANTEEHLKYGYSVELEFPTDLSFILYEVCASDTASLSSNPVMEKVEEVAAYSKNYTKQSKISLRPACDSGSAYYVYFNENVTGQVSATTQRYDLTWQMFIELFTRSLPQKDRTAAINFGSIAYSILYGFLAYCVCWVPMYAICVVIGIIGLCCKRPGPGAKSRFATAILFYPLPVLGLHRLYLGQCCVSIIFTCTLGGLGLWSLVDACRLGALVRKTGSPSFKF